MDDWLIDGSKLHLHPARVAQWLAADTWEKAKKVVPLYWEVTTSAACQHRCTFCSTEDIGYPADLMDVKVLNARMKEAGAMGVKSVMFAGTGEPLVHKRISDICVGAYLAGLDYAFTTNGVLMLRDAQPKPGLLGATWIKVSVNAGDRDTYAKVHQTKPSDWDTLWMSLKIMMQMRDATSSKTTIGAQCVVLPENVYTLANLAKVCAETGLDYLVLKPYTQATFMTSHRYDGMDYAAMREELDRVKNLKLGKLKIIHRSTAMAEEISKKHSYDKCRATPMFWIYSKGDGEVFTCSAHLMDKRFSIGNLNEQTFQEIWEGEKRRENWEMMQDFDIKQCRLNCRQNNQNKYLHQLKHQPHINFP